MRTTSRFLIATPVVAVVLLLALSLVRESLGQSATAAAQQRFQYWALYCLSTNVAPAQRCVAYTQNGNETTRGPVAARLSIQRAQGGGFMLVFDVTPGSGNILSLQIDDAAPLGTSGLQCQGEKCRAIVGGPSAQSIVQQLRRGRTAVVGFTMADNTPVRIKLSLSGVTAALNAMNASR